MNDSFQCGPLQVSVAAGTDALRDKVADQLGLFNVAWQAPLEPVAIEIGESDEPVAMGAGAYLTCARMHVDRDADGLVATCHSGAWARYEASSERWCLAVPRRPGDLWVMTDIESLLSLVVTTGWRRRGWVPLHGGAIVRGERCAVLCAESGGGKTSLTAALIREGCQTLGDDKLLLRLDRASVPELRALVHTFNLAPRTRRWFPEVGDLERLPTYSEWTDKRKVPPEAIWPGTTRDRARPTHLFRIARASSEGGRGVEVEPLSAADVLSTLLHQTVVPSVREVARPILAAVAATAQRLEGLRVTVGEDAYGEPGCLAPLIEAWG